LKGALSITGEVTAPRNQTFSVAAPQNEPYIDAAAGSSDDFKRIELSPGMNLTAESWKASNR
jgi:hypothetical protein